MGAPSLPRDPVLTVWLVPITTAGQAVFTLLVGVGLFALIVHGVKRGWWRP